MGLRGEAPGDPTYNIVATIPGGGQGLVMRAEHLGFGRACVQKTVFLPNAGLSLAARFREARIMDALRDEETVATVMDVQPNPQYPGAITIVMDYYPEGSVHDALASGRRFSLSEAVAITCDVLTAVRRMHIELGYVHSDIKPRNVLLWNGGTRGALTDFGGSHEIAAGAAQLTTWTWPYLAPEVVAGGMAAVTPASDLYAVGITLFETLCGPFPANLLGPAAEARLRGGFRGIPDAHLTFDAHLPADIRRLVTRAFRRDPGRRPSTASEFQQALRLAKFIDWRRLSGVGSEGRWEGSWPPKRPASARRRFRIDVTRTRRGLTAAATQQLTATGPWRRMSFFADMTLDPSDPSRSLSQFFQALSDEVAKRFPSS